jgi:putative nucleotidyltransferase with HDIG domain
MTRWWLEWLQSILQSTLDWVKAIQGKSPRKEGTAFFRRDVHVPTPIVATGSVAALFIVLVPRVGFQPAHLMVLAGMLALLLVFFVLYVRSDLPQFVHDDEAVFLTGLCVVLGVLLIEAVQRMPAASYAVIPLGGIAILITLLLHMRLAMIISIVLCLLAGTLYHYSLDVTLVLFGACASGILASRRVHTRGDILRAGFHVAWVTFVAMTGIDALRGHLMSRMGAFGWSLLPHAGWALGGGLLSSGITLALLPFLESFFSRVTNITLLELGDFNRPLLRRLMLEAPGTYHHTLLVAALAEQASEAIGANSLLARVGMYYHDIGKMLHPEYFIENQTMRRSAKEKPEHHDKLNPSISSLVILSHVKDGMALARAYNVPQEIARFIPEHHGTSLIKYFYVQALEKNEEEATAAESSYRYPGPRPHSKETAIGMMADSVEAASRALEEPTYERLHDLVEKIVFSKLQDNQFDECPLTMEDLRKIIKSFAQALSAIYHVRIEYPEMQKS